MLSITTKLLLTYRPVVSEYHNRPPAFSLCVVEPVHSFDRRGRSARTFFVTAAQVNDIVRHS